MNQMENWQKLSFWQRSTVSVLALMWVAFSGAVIANLSNPGYLTVTALCLLWLPFIAIARGITKDYT
jgi:hypothetical protein